MRRCSFLLLAALLLMASVRVWAVDYVIRNGDTSGLPFCSSGSWTQSGTTFTCGGRVTLGNGDTLRVSESAGEILDDVTLQAPAGFELNNNVIGNSNKRIHLSADYGELTANGNNSIFGDISTRSGAINLNGTSVQGSIDTDSTLTMNNGRVSGDIVADNGIRLTDTQVSGTLTAVSGSIVLRGGDVQGLVRSNCCFIDADGTGLYGGARSEANGFNIRNATIEGGFYAANNAAELTNVDMLGGTISGASSLEVNDSTLGSTSSPVEITTQSGAITLNDSQAYGDLTTPNWSSVIANGTSVVIGTCTPRSTPTSACMATPPLTCLSDDFGRSALGDDWVVSTFSGGFSPSIRSGRLLLTEDADQQSTASTLQRLFPADNNKIVVEFDHYAWSPDIFGEGADGITLVFSDARVTPQAGSYGGSLGYAQRTNSRNDDGFAGGWLGIALDEYGNFSNPTEGRIGGPGFRSDSVTVRGSGEGTGGYAYITGAHRLNPSIDTRWSWFGANPGYRYSITIDASVAGTAILSVERDTGRGFTELIAPLDVAAVSGQSAIPENLLLSVTGSTGDYSNNHAIDDLEVCANIINPMDALVHHFEFYYSSRALTCSPQEVLIRACANADCSTLYTDPVELTMAPGGWEGGDTISIRGGETTAALWHTTPESVDLAVRSSQPLSLAYSTNLCIKDGQPAGTDCSMTFSDSGFIVDSPDFTAGQGLASASIQAVQKDDSSRQCVPAFANVRKDIALWGDYVSPAAENRVVSWPLLVNGREIAMNETSATTTRLSFDATGTARFRLNYNDAGLMQLNARYRADSSADDAGAELNGNGRFVSVPAGFCLHTGGECSQADSRCEAFAVAGENFPLRIQAVGWQRDGDTDMCQGNRPTPSFSQPDMTLSSAVVSPSTGSDGVVTPALYQHTAAADNINTVTVNQSEAGVFNFIVRARSDYYGQTLPEGVSAPSGRFYPHHFSARVLNNGELNAACNAAGAFTYTGQSFGWLTAPRLQLTAQNAAGVTTQNYTAAGFRKLEATDIRIGAVTQDNQTVDRDGNAMLFNASVFSGLLAVSSPGVLQYDLSATDAFYYDKTLTTKIAPFSPDLTFSLNSATDSDGVSLQARADFLPEAGFDIRYGRLWLNNAYGPETLDLTMDMEAEYFDGSEFVSNTDDSCWHYDAAAQVVLSPDNITQVAGHSGTLVNGLAEDAILLRAPVNVAGGQDTGEVDVTYPAPLWLQDDVDLDGVFDDPMGTASFGVYRGHDRIIYWREKKGF